VSSRFEFGDADSTFARTRRVADNGQYNKIQLAYRAYIDHGGSCATCAVDSAQCATAEELWEAYHGANSS
jgi:hypothetical protein